MSDYISEDTLIQIMQYLPARNIVRLRVVCKSWKELIDSDELTLKHLALQKPGFLVEYGETRFVAVELGFQPPLTHAVRCPIQGNISFIGTHHGIVCLDGGDGNVYLWNPSTSKHLSIFLPTNFNFGRPCCKSFHIDPLSKEYQVVILFFKEVSPDYVSVTGILYSSVEKDWSLVPRQRIGWGWVFGQARHDVLVGGVAYWTDGLLLAALSFDFSEKTVELIKLPNRDMVYGSPTGEGELIEFGDPIELIQWKGAFSALCYAANCDDTFEINSWMEGSWTSMLRFEIPSPETPFSLLAMAGTDQKFWTLYDVMVKQGKQGKKKARRVSFNDLYLYESGVGCSFLMSGDHSPIAHDFVESLLFP